MTAMKKITTCGTMISVGGNLETNADNGEIFELEVLRCEDSRNAFGNTDGVFQRFESSCLGHLSLLGVVNVSLQPPYRFFRHFGGHFPLG